ncbi:free fatty acid receptor 3-like [Erythrolamprus reginae]|uniref:free fatty acid receptor 3-like n=1 Tax=Erythrolamprus reginae TaxID=121349 RepID=UPI00396C3184
MAPDSETRNTYIAVYALTVLIGLPTNLLALSAFIQKMRVKATSNCIFLLNLTISDLGFLVFLLFKMAEQIAGRWAFPPFLCPLSGFAYFSTIYTSMLFLTAVSVDRYLGVAYPIQYKLRCQAVYAQIASLVIWIWSFGHCSIVYITEFNRDNYSLPSGPSRNVCYDLFTEKQLQILLPVRLEVSIVLFLVPFLITCFCYFGFVRIVISSPRIHRSKKHRAVGLVAATLAVFIICFAPYNISHVVSYVQWENPEWRMKVLLLSTFNACLDPIIFYFSSSAVKHSCCSFWTRIKDICRLPPLLHKLFNRRTERTSPQDQVCSSRLRPPDFGKFLNPSLEVKWTGQNCSGN